MVALLTRGLKRSLGFIATTIVVVIVVAIVAVELISWNFLKSRIAAEVESATGRELSIAGDVDIGLWPRPAITLNDVSLANPDWVGNAHFIELDRLRVAPDLLALIRGRLVLAEVDVDAPVIRLVQRSGGPANWVLAGSGEGNAEPVPVHRLSVTRAEIEYGPAGRDESLSVRVPMVRLRDDGQASSLVATVAFRHREIEIEADTDSLFSAPWPDDSFDGQMRIAAAQSYIDSEFSVSQSSFPARWQTRIEGDIDDLGGWIGLVPGVESSDIGSLVFEASLARSGSTWTAEGVDLTAMEGRLQADLGMDTAGEITALTGSIRSRAINVAALRDALPAADGSAPKPDSIPLPPVFPRLDGSVKIDIEQVAGLAVPITGAAGEVLFDAHELSIEDLEMAVAGGTIRGSARVASAPETVSGGLALAARELKLGEGDGSGPMLDGDFDIGLNAVSRERWSSATIARNLDIETARIGYDNPIKDTKLSLIARLTGDGARPVLALSGTLKGKPLDAEIEGDALAAARPGPAYGLNGRATSASLALSVDTTLRSVLNAEAFTGRLSLAGDSVGDLEPWLGLELPQTPPFDVSGTLDRDGALWKADGLQLEIGESNLGGGVQVDAGDRLHVAATLHAEPLDLAWLQSLQAGAAPEEAPDGGRRSSGSTDLAWLRGFDGELELSAAEVRLVDVPNLDELELNVALEAGLVDIREFSAGVAGGTLSFEGHLDASAIPASARIGARFDDIALARLGDTFSPLEERLGLLSGSVNVSGTQTLDEAFRDDIVAPMIGRLKIEPSELRFSDASADTDFTLNARTEGLEEDAQRFRVDGEGRYDGAPFSLRLVGDALLDARLPDRPWAVDLDATVVESRIGVDGTLLRPLALRGLELVLSLQGPDPQRLSRLLGVPLPELPPYEVSGQLGLEQGRWLLSELDGTVGNSDLRGQLAFDPGATPPRVSGNLRSDSLDLDDLGSLVGVETGDDGAGTQDRFVLPDDPFIGPGVQRVNADLRYRGASVRAGGVPLTELVIDFRIDDGVARFEPVGFGVGDGRTDFTLVLDTKEQPAAGTLSLEVRHVDLRTALRDWDLADDSVGIIGARGKFWVKGRSVAELLASADGGAVMLMTGGRLEAVLVELAGLDAAQAFTSWLGDRDGIPVDCAYADLKARNGTVTLDTFVVDTRDTIFSAGGQANLNTERLDVSIVAHPTDASALVGRTPFHIGGTFDAIEVGIHGGELGLRVGASLALGAVAGPIGALLPLLETGTHERTGYCDGLVAATREAINNDEDPKP